LDADDNDQKPAAVSGGKVKQKRAVKSIIGDYGSDSDDHNDDHKPAGSNAEVKSIDDKMPPNRSCTREL
jgi:hypothetical protein